MMFVLLLLLSQSPTAPIERQVLELEHSRGQDVSVLMTALKSSDPAIQRQAVRTAGRLERLSLKDAIVPLLRAPDALVRAEAANAMGQIRAAYDYGALVKTEASGEVRAVLFDTIGRVVPVPVESEQLLVAGLTDKEPAARTGAARGLESLFRLNRTLKPAPETVAALRQAFAANQTAHLRELVLLALNAAGDKDPATFALALADSDVQVRRLAVLGSRQWVDDPSPMVRYEAMRLAGTCERAATALGDSSELVVLAAIDFAGRNNCPATTIEPLVKGGKTWRVRSRALVSLARLAPDSARPYVPAMAADPVWQARTYAATAAKLLKDEATREQLARDPDPNVVIAAMATGADAVRALSSNHAGLLEAAARLLKGTPELPAAVPQVLATLQRLTRTGHATVRDPRVQLLERLREAGDAATIEQLRTLLADRDPVVASLAADIISKKTGTTVAAKTAEYVPEPLPSDETLRGLRGATAVITMKDLGTITLELMVEEAPVTVATFAALAGQGRFNGLTFHRFAANFVIQGGSPGANEMDGATAQFMRDEVGQPSHLRGTLGISTRGHDTGDGQIFVNLIDNFRLDHQYTVFARVTGGMDVVDRILEGDVMTSVTIRRER
jgi:cyclophilin family peptidyl-prolyl cis-trans isomerase/HEAT repeat protein